MVTFPHKKTLLNYKTVFFIFKLIKKNIKFIYYSIQIHIHMSLSHMGN